jgi:hypothetical protein
LPHSRQQIFDRDVIKPQNGHIRSDLGPSLFGFSGMLPRSLYAKTAVNNTTSRLQMMTIALIKTPFNIDATGAGA